MRKKLPWPDQIGMFVASGAGMGYVPRAPGTAGSLLSAGLFALVRFNYFGSGFHAGHAAVIVLLFFGGVWAGDVAERVLNRRDPPTVVIDEIVGQQISYFALPAFGWKSWLAGIILFRVFDIWKPFPIRRLERAPGGWGLMLDDVLAGIYALAVLQVAERLLG